ncbi:MAG: 30S ribosomal protein S17 [Acidimicrobiia bacterium]|nr:30S ribosomal protein S17 [Acidimicrobiia bacterium]
MTDETTTDTDTVVDGAAKDAATTAESEAPAAGDAPPETRSARKVREGLVVSDKMDKTAVVEVVDRVRHAKYNKFILRTKKLYAHDETNDVNIGDKVRVMETRALSKKKRWRVTDVLERAK